MLVTSTGLDFGGTVSVVRGKDGGQGEWKKGETKEQKEESDEGNEMEMKRTRKEEEEAQM